MSGGILMALMALPGVIVGGAVAFFTWKAQRAARAFLLAELVWLLVLAGVAVLPAHGDGSVKTPDALVLDARRQS